MIITVNTMKSQKKLSKNIAAFTYIETLICLTIASFSILMLTTSVDIIFIKARHHLFFIEFENFYRHCQKITILKRSAGEMEFAERSITYQSEQMELPKTIKLGFVNKVKLNQYGGNHSLAKINFISSDEIITYTLNLGSGTYKKSKD